MTKAKSFFGLSAAEVRAVEMNGVFRASAAVVEPRKPEEPLQNFGTPCPKCKNEHPEVTWTRTLYWRDEYGHLSEFREWNKPSERGGERLKVKCSCGYRYLTVCADAQ
jgi:hypothetical protein